MGRKCCITVGNKNKRASRLHPFELFSLFFFFLSLGIRKNEMDRMGSCFEREEALEKSKRVGCVDDELHEGEWNTPEHLGLCFQIICIIVYCGGATQSWRDVITGGRAFTYIKSWLPWSSSIRVFFLVFSHLPAQLVAGISLPCRLISRFARSREEEDPPPVFADSKRREPGIYEFAIEPSFES